MSDDEVKAHIARYVARKGGIRRHPEGKTTHLVVRCRNVDTIPQYRLVTDHNGQEHLKNEAGEWIY